MKTNLCTDFLCGMMPLGCRFSTYEVESIWKHKGKETRQQELTTGT